METIFLHLSGKDTFLNVTKKVRATVSLHCVFNIFMSNRFQL